MSAATRAAASSPPTVSSRSASCDSTRLSAASGSAVKRQTRRRTSGSAARAVSASSVSRLAALPRCDPIRPAAHQPGETRVGRPRIPAARSAQTCLGRMRTCQVAS
ncbi:MAG: hypothetical protein MZV64_30170 [Ignavibacteriales bacterium]|nr:hypothetical protein [Ignavibacteriales bacterium]